MSFFNGWIKLKSLFILFMKGYVHSIDVSTSLYAF
jgi:hypothetical protein